VLCKNQPQPPTYTWCATNESISSEIKESPDFWWKEDLSYSTMAGKNSMLLNVDLANPSAGTSGLSAQDLTKEFGFICEVNL